MKKLLPSSGLRVFGPLENDDGSCWLMPPTLFLPPAPIRLTMRARFPWEDRVSGQPLRDLRLLHDAVFRLYNGTRLTMLNSRYLMSHKTYLDCVHNANPYDWLARRSDHGGGSDRSIEVVNAELYGYRLPPISSPLLEDGAWLPDGVALLAVAESFAEVHSRGQPLGHRPQGCAVLFC